MINSKINNLWVVVIVESGIPTTVEAYISKEDAIKKETYYRSNMNPENDETGVFNIIIPN